MPQDASPWAIANNDKTLIHGICKKAPGQGIDVCRVVEGSPIDGNWTIYLPWDASAISATVRVRFKDKVQTFKAVEQVVEIPLKDVLGADKWGPQHDGILQAVVTVQLDPGGPIRFVQALGYAYIIVLQPGYSPLPINDAQVFSKLNCTLEYTDAGRSAYSCKER